MIVIVLCVISCKGLNHHEAKEQLEMKDNSSSITKALIFCALTSALFIMIHFSYYDCVDAVRNSVNVWYALFDGDFLNYYSYTRYAEHEVTFPVFQMVHNGASYSYLVYLFFGIWLFPLYILERYLGINLFWHAWGVMYAKVGLILVSIVNAFLLKKIIFKVTSDERKADIAPLLYFTSPLFFSCTVVVGQLEAITVMFMLFAFWYYIQGKNSLFLLFFAFAMPFKYFAFLAFIPLLILEEKNLLKIVGKTIVVIAPTIVSSIIFFYDRHRYVGTMEGSNRPIGDNMLTLLADGMMSSGSTWKIGDISFNLFIVVMFLLWWWCYLQKATDKYDLAQKAFFASFISMLSFLILFSPVYPYWCLLLLPFAIGSVLLNSNNVENVIAIESIASISYLMWQFVNYYWVFGLYGMQCNVFLSEKAPYAITGISIRNYTDVIGSYLGISITSLYLLGFGSLLLLSYISLALLVFPKTSIKCCGEIKKSVILMRFLSTALCMILLISAVYFLMFYKNLI